MKINMGALLIFISLRLVAQDGATKINTSEVSPTRPRSSDELNKESSSFVPDPDSLDPLPVKKENLKEDEEPVLEDIRQVLDAPSSVRPKPATPKAKLKKKDVSRTEKKQSLTKSSTSRKAKISSRKSLTARKTNQQDGRTLQDDNPDLTIENNFHKVYKAYNAEPTSIEGWTSVLNGRDSESYTVQKNDTLWSISKTLFGDPNYWPKLWSLNKRGILNPHFITPGLQVLFYSGSADKIPSMALADAENAEALGGVPSSPAAANGSPGRKIRKSTDKNESVSRKNPGFIPDSLPISRNDNYFLPPQNLKIELMSQPEIPDDFTSDIILTDQKIVSEVEITKDEILKGRCGGDHVLKSSQIQGGEGVLKIYESLQNLDTDAGDIFPYRYVGEAKILSDQKIRITSCNTVISPSLFFVSPSKVDSWRTSKTSAQAVPTIIGGPNIVAQMIFSNHQVIYLNLGAQTAEIGQSVTVQSKLTDRPSGEIRIIDKFGSFAIGIVTKVQDLIETGDQVQLQ